MRRIVIGAVVLITTACSAERLTAKPQPQKSALLSCSYLRTSNTACPGEKPLLLIDGQRASWDTTNDLNPSEIETVEVVKGPAALSLYGDEGRHGVVQITTRKGKAGKL